MRWIEPEISVLEFGDGFQIRCVIPDGTPSRFEEIAFLRKADGWTRETATRIPDLAARISRSKSIHTKEEKG